jgi:hypothetical protein
MMAIPDFLKKAPDEILQEGYEGLFSASEALALVLATNPLPWRAIWRPNPKAKPLLDKSGKNPVLAASLLCSEARDKIPANRRRLVEKQLESMDNVNAALGMSVFPEHARADSYYAEPKGKGMGRVKDRCDGCDREAARSADMKRCGRWKVARYCNSDCATKDWKTGHKQRGFEAVSLFKK